METRYTSNITKSTQAFNRLKEQSADFDLFELTDARLALRPSMEEAAQERIRKEAPDGKISIRGFWTDKLLREDGMVAWHKAFSAPFAAFEPYRQPYSELFRQ